MPKMGISVDETTHKLLKRHGGERHVGVLIGKMIRDFDKEESFGPAMVRKQLERIEDRLCQLCERV